MTSLPKSSYLYQREAKSRPDKYAALRIKIKEVFIENQNCYGYRRIHVDTKSKGMVVSEKVVRRIMEEEQLVIPWKKRHKYSSYKGEISPAV